MNPRLTAMSLVTALLTAGAFGAQPADTSNVAIFAGGDLTFNGHNTVIGGAIVANGNVLHNGNVLTFESLYAGGTFSDTPASFQDSSGDILFGGDITNLGGPGSTFGGNITSGGSIAFLASAGVTGHVTARLNVSLPSFGSIGGNLLAGGNVNLQGNVGGNLTYGNNFTLGTFAHVSGATTHGGPVTPTPFVPMTLPAGHNFTPGVTDVTLSTFETRSLAPGAYRALSFAGSSTLKLTAGQYIFDSFSNTSPLNHLSFDTSAGPISIYVKGDFNFSMIQDINGVSYFAGTKPDPHLSQKIFWETAGNFIAGRSLYGTVFAPNGDVTFNNFADATGQVLGGHNVTFNSGSVTLVPEPASLTVLGLAAAAFFKRRKRAVVSA